MGMIIILQLISIIIGLPICVYAVYQFFKKQKEEEKILFMNLPAFFYFIIVLIITILIITKNAYPSFDYTSYVRIAIVIMMPFTVLLILSSLITGITGLVKGIKEKKNNMMIYSIITIFIAITYPIIPYGIVILAIIFVVMFIKLKKEKTKNDL